VAEPTKSYPDMTSCKVQLRTRAVTVKDTTNNCERSLVASPTSVFSQYQASSLTRPAEILTDRVQQALISDGVSMYARHQVRSAIT
jgi:hypothetical protein